MKQYIVDLSKKYGIPYETMEDLVLEVVEHIEKGLPVSVIEKIEEELGGTIKETIMTRSGLFPIP